MRKVHSAASLQEAELLRMILRSHGIESALENEGGALYAVGLPSAAVPLVISVDDEHADEAVRVILAHFQKRSEPVPTELMVQIPCACGKTLEFPKGEEPPSECPWCGKPTQAVLAPQAPHTASPLPRLILALVAVGVLFMLGTISFAGYRGFRTVRNQFRAISSPVPVDPHPALARQLKERIQAIPTPTLPPIDPGEIAAALTKELPEVEARFSQVLNGATTVDGLADQWLHLTADLAPDWAMELGLADTPRLGRYSTRVMKCHFLLSALTLRRLRSLNSAATSLDGRLLERFLQRGLLAYLLFGPELRDPRAALWGVEASLYAKGRPALLAERLEQVPAVVAEVRRELRGVNGLLLDLSLHELNETMEMLRDFEKSSSEERLIASVAAARDALSEYASHLRKLKADPAPLPPADPRWVLFLVRDAEFSGRTPRETALKLFDESERMLQRWNASGGKLQPITASYSADEWRGEVRGFLDRARELTLERGFAEIPPGEMPEIVVSPLRSRGSPNFPAYGSRVLEPSLHGILWVTLWDAAGTPNLSCSPTTGLVCTLAETFPGRHLHTLLSRREGSLIRRLYGSHGLAEGWRAYCQRWALEVVPKTEYDSIYADGTKSSQAWIAAVEICFLAGTLSENEAVEMLKGSLGESEETARSRLAFVLVEPLHGAGAILGERDLLDLRDELTLKLGPRFDLKRFHTRLLEFGRTPIPLIREEMLRDGK